MGLNPTYVISIKKQTHKQTKKQLSDLVWHLPYDFFRTWHDVRGH